MRLAAMKSVTHEAKGSSNVLLVCDYDQLLGYLGEPEVDTPWLVQTGFAS